MVCTECRKLSKTHNKNKKTYILGKTNSPSKDGDVEKFWDSASCNENSHCPFEYVFVGEQCLGGYGGGMRERVA